MAEADGPVHRKHLLKEDGGEAENLRRGVGIHALELYTPRHCATAKQLEDWFEAGETAGGRPG